MAHAQMTSTPAQVQYKPTAADMCDYRAAVRFGPDFSNSGPAPHELREQVAEARPLCEQAVLDQPKSARLWANLARVRATALDGPAAIEAARKGAELGSANAEVILGVIYADGAMIERDYVSAREHWLRAAKLGSPYAHFNLGVLLTNGWGVVPDEAEAKASFQRAAQGRDPLAMQLVAQRYERERADELLKKAAEAMYPDAFRNPLRIANFGRAAPDGGAFVAWYEEQARGGALWADTYLGMLYEAGQWVRQDYALAAERYRAAGEAGHWPAQVRMAILYRDGKGVPKDEKERLRWTFMQQTQRCEALERADTGADPCDRYAADRYDRDRAGDAVDSFCMRQFATRAITACTAAVKRSPATVRYRTQLARALAHTGQFKEARREAALAAEHGSSAAMILMGVMTQRGLGAPVDEKQALGWYRKAAEAGDQRGVAFVMTSVHGGVGVEQGSAEANALASDMRTRIAVRSAPAPEEMAARGDAREQHNLAARLEREKRYDEAVKWYSRAAAQGFRPAQLNLAQMYEKGIGVPQDTMKARRSYRAMAAAGDKEGALRAAKLAAEAEDWREAIPAYERLARDDNLSALTDLGLLYEQGRGVPRDGARAVALFEKAADRSRWARHKLGVAYLDDRLVPRDYVKARYWLERSARDGNASARNNLGFIYERGLGVKAEAVKAREYYFAALRGREPRAKGNLERHYAAGRDAPPGAAALDWYREGAERDIASAQYRLGLVYLNGEGVERNEDTALQWLARAGRQGHLQARKEAGELYFKQGKDAEAIELGNAAAARKFALRLQLGYPGIYSEGRGSPSYAEFMRQFEERERAIASRPPPPDGLALEVEVEKPPALRFASAGSVQGIGLDPSFASPYEVIRWFPETDGKPK
ncbi:MAG TPA: tetratricopeptide repeat protein [Burkholderiales bacterium]